MRSDSPGSENPVLRLADELADQKAPLDEARQKIERLAMHVETRRLEEARIAACAGYRTVRHADLTFQIVAEILHRRGFDDAAEEIHYVAADTLSDVVSVESLEAAVRHFEACCTYRGQNFFPARLNQAGAHYMLAGLCSEALENLAAASDITSVLVSGVETATYPYFCVRQVEACIAVEYAFNGVDRGGNLELGVSIAEEVIAGTYPDDIAAQAFLTKAKALKLKAATVERPVELLVEGIEACERGRAITDTSSNPAHDSRLLCTESAIRITLAQLGVEPIQNARCGLDMARQAESRSDLFECDLLSLWACQAIALQLLFKWRADGSTVESLTKAIAIARRAESIASENHFERGPMALCQANCHLQLSECGENSEDHLVRAIEQIDALKEIRTHAPGLTVAAAVTGATIRKKLAERGQQPADHLRRSIDDCIDAGKTLEGAGRYRDFLYIVRAAAHSALADLGIERDKNLRAAIFLCSECSPPEATTDPIALKAHLDAAFAMRKLADLGVDTKQNLNTAIDRCAMVARASEPGAVSNPLHRELLNSAIDGIVSCLTTLSAHESDLSSALQYLDDAIRFAERIRAELSADTPMYRDALLNEAILRFSIGTLQQEERELKHALCLCNEAATAFPLQSRQWAACQAIAADCEYHLGSKQTCVERLENAIRTHLNVRMEFSREEDRVSYESRIHHLFVRAVTCAVELADEIVERAALAGYLRGAKKQLLQ